MVECGFDGLPFMQVIMCLCAEISLAKGFPNIVHGLWGGMEHIFGIKPIVAQGIIHDFIGWEIVGRPGFHQFMRCQKQGGFAQLASMKTIFLVANGTYREHDFRVGVAISHLLNSLFQRLGAVSYAQFLFLKPILWLFLTIIYNLSCTFQPINMVGTQREYQYIRQRCCVG